jgi:hypothetical protein
MSAQTPIAEFYRAADEPVDLDNSGDPALASGRGAIRLAPAAHARVHAYEAPSRGNRQGWMQGITVSLPAPESALSARQGITDLGPDRDAIRAEDQDALLFDLGLGIDHIDACVRTRDAELIACLRESAGQDPLAPGHPAIGAVLASQPHRVFVSRLARLEVFEPIPLSDADKALLNGPHTHILPDLLADDASHSVPVAVPAGHLCGVEVHPASPLHDLLGHRIEFDRARFETFQRQLGRWGDPVYVAEKARATAAMRAGAAPALPAPEARDAWRVAQRQLAKTDPGLAGLRDWRRLLEAPA